jgi:hypothetical protein
MLAADPPLSGDHLLLAVTVLFVLVAEARYERRFARRGRAF